MSDKLVTVEEAKAYLRIDGEEEDALVSSLIILAQDCCEDILRYELTEELMEPPIKQAILILVTHFYEERSGEDVPEVVYTLLRPYRKAEW